LSNPLPKAGAKAKRLLAKSLVAGECGEIRAQGNAARAKFHPVEKERI
jgi:hypothetical protein